MNRCLLDLIFAKSDFDFWLAVICTPSPIRNIGNRHHFFLLCHANLTSKTHNNNDVYVNLKINEYKANYLEVVKRQNGLSDPAHGRPCPSLKTNKEPTMNRQQTTHKKQKRICSRNKIITAMDYITIRQIINMMTKSPTSRKHFKTNGFWRTHPRVRFLYTITQIRYRLQTLEII